MTAKLTYPMPSGWRAPEWVKTLRAKAVDIDEEIKRWASPQHKKARADAAASLRRDADAIERGLAEG